MLLVPVLASALFLALAEAAPAASPPRVRTKVSVVLTTTDQRHELSPVAPLGFSAKAPANLPVIDVNENTRYQRFTGLGGAFTDASAWLIHDQLHPGTRAWLLRRLFSSSGIHLNFIRVPMAASDFTATGVPYSYDDQHFPHIDPTLADFSIAHDYAYVIPAIKQALSIQPHAFIIATPWSPPGWMKTNQILGNPANRRGFLLDSDYEPLAQYFVKFLKAYAAAGIHVTAVTPQNEPDQNTSYPGLEFPEPSEATFVSRYLAPALRDARLHTDIYGYDHGWDPTTMKYAFALAGSPAVQDLSGFASHCYNGEPTEVAALHYAAPELDEVVSECSPGSKIFSAAELEIASLRNWASGFALWNLALDPAGGPVQPPNNGCLGCTGIVTINPATHTVRFNRAYYQLGQVSKYVEPGAVRIASNTFVTYVNDPITKTITTPGVDNVAFINPDQSRVLIAYNGATVTVHFGVKDDGYYFHYQLAPKSTATFMWRSPTGKRTPPPSAQQLDGAGGG